ncbi:putative ribonuclease III [Medicago truncatula]|uniref:Putative ribonuclease III n=1 Tax=Medicago truncatula TaxID=3880 RepID=G7J6P2_MEDTR|nr:ribonuclease 3-like protein [Medicago truncatula]RHN68922.1 putative ribonuclease III [Medicago truncatula]
MEAQVHKVQEEEEVLFIQTQALKIDKEELSLKQQEKEDTTNNNNNNKDSPPPPPLYEVEAILGYEFKNKHLLEEAFTHSTYGAEDDLSYEQLEYLGDAVLGLLVAKEQFFSYPNLKPNFLTLLR